MSSEYSIHLGDKPTKGRVFDLGDWSGIMVTVEVEAPSNAGASLRLFVGRDRLLEASLLFHKIAQDLAALLPDGSPLPRTEEGQVALPPTAAEMGREALERHRAEPEGGDFRRRENLLVALDDLFECDYRSISSEEWSIAREAFKAAISELQCPDGCDTSCRCYREGLEAQRRPLGC